MASTQKMAAIRRKLGEEYLGQLAKMQPNLKTIPLTAKPAKYKILEVVARPEQVNSRQWSDGLVVRMSDTGAYTHGHTVTQLIKLHQKEPDGAKLFKALGDINRFDQESAMKAAQVVLDFARRKHPGFDNAKLATQARVLDKLLKFFYRAVEVPQSSKFGFIGSSNIKVRVTKARSPLV